MGHDEIVLDNDQEKAAAITSGPVLVLAGAGAGKTATLTERSARMIESGMPPENLLKLTFSRKAAREMYARLRDRLGNPGRDKMPTIENFHSFGWRLIQAAPEKCQRRSGVSLVDPADQKKMLRKLLKEQSQGFQEAIPLKRLMTIQDILSNEGLMLGDPTAAKDDAERRQSIIEVLEKSDVERRHWAELNNALSQYNTEKRDANVVDFGDLIALPLSGLTLHPEWAEQLSDRFPSVAVDEAQDTNRAQYQMVRTFTKHNNLMLVGDDDQCIYEWRGARPRNLQEFLDETGARIVRLERNYRSAPSIVEAAAVHIKHNVNRIPKTPFSGRQHQGTPPRAQLHDAGEDMSGAIADDIKAQIDRGVPPKRIAVLYRTNRMAGVLEPALIARGIPYHVAQGVDLFDRQEAQLLMAAVRYNINPSDSFAVTKLATLVDGLGEKSLGALIGHAAVHDTPILESRHHVRLNKRAAAAAESLANRMAALEKWPPLFLSSWALDPDGGDFEGKLQEMSKQAERPKEAFNRRLKTLVDIEDAIHARFGSSDQSSVDSELSRREQWTAIQEMGIATPDEEMDHDAVTLATVFKVKGLEYHTVHVAGMSAGLMPMERRSSGPEDDDDASTNSLEEERRLSYVAATRARERLVVHHANEIYWGYERAKYQPSGFASEMGLEWEVAAAPELVTSRASELKEDVFEKMRSKATALGI
ncbi:MULTISPECIES: ATP-dependent helicase [unclassified Thioalkalivibrio]|uniref:ATP-dependent helicase n=1 Tax=unclassified Thioalkalivibrio TaxID=2621013 RepID=UPI00035EF389|nr:MULTISPECIES: ATP-dependent helicase [unclassified Thioalkalivibrio]